jgi:hypothetical protein
MTNPAAPKSKIQKLNHQLSLLKEIYEQRIHDGKEYSSLKNIEGQIRELEKIIRESFAKQ